MYRGNHSLLCLAHQGNRHNPHNRARPQHQGNPGHYRPGSNRLSNQVHRGNHSPAHRQRNNQARPQHQGNNQQRNSRDKRSNPARNQHPVNNHNPLMRNSRLPNQVHPSNRANRRPPNLDCNSCWRQKRRWISKN